MTCSLALLACKQGKSEIAGFGVYEVGKTTPKDGYVCRPDGDDPELTYCSNNPSPMIAGHRTQTDLYFRGHDENKSPLVEILVGVWDCKPGPVGVALEEELGAPSSKEGRVSRWDLKKISVVALLPSDNNLCTVHFLHPKETARIAELSASK